MKALKSLRLIEIAVGLLLLVMLFVITDCSAGKTGSVEVQVIKVVFVPQEVSVSMQTDSEGNMRSHTNTDPAHYLITFREPTEEGDKYHTIRTDLTTGARINADDWINVKFRTGRFTNWRYLKRPSL